MTLANRNEGPFTLTSGEALEEARFVKLSAGTAVYADAGDEPIGITAEAVDTASPVSVYPLKGVVERVTASKAISLGSAIYVAADGKVSDAAVGKQIGVNMQASTANGGKVAAIVWGPRGGNDVLTPSNGVVKYMDDFIEFDGTATVGNWAETDAGTEGSAAQSDSVNGAVDITVTGTDNNEVYFSSASEAFKFQTNKKLYFETKIKLTETNTDDANWCIGLSDVVAANTLVDNGAGLVTTFDGALFYKVDGTMNIMFNTSNGATQGTPVTMGAFVSGTSYTLGFMYDYNDGVTAKVTPYLNGVAGTTQNLTISGLDEMHILMGLKAGGANAEHLFVDYVSCQQER